MTPWHPRLLLATVLALVPIAALADPCPESCLNDNCNTEVASQPASWGALKLRYR
jgi:hypothetical protein